MTRSKSVKALALLICAALLCGCMGGYGHVAVPAVAGYHNLTEYEKQLYDGMVDALYNHSQLTIPSRYQVSEAELSMMHEIILADHPEIFWADGFQYERIGEVCINYRPLYTHKPEDAAEESARVDAAVQAIADSASVFSSEYDQALFVHDYLVSSITYSDELGGDGAYDVRGALLHGSCVCAGYAKAFQLIAYRLGIECYYVVGDADGEGHAWNIAKLDGIFTLIDPTFNDPVSENQLLLHSYFGPDPAPLESRRITSGVYPYPIAQENSYFSRKGLDGSLAEIADQAILAGAANVQNGRYYVEFRSDTAGSDVMDYELVGDIIRGINGLLGEQLCDPYQYMHSSDEAAGTAVIYFIPFS